AARIADHARAATDHGNRPMPSALKVSERHDADQVARVQAGRGRVEALVQRDLATVQRTPQPGLVGDLRDEPACFERVDNACGGRGPWCAPSTEPCRSPPRAPPPPTTLGAAPGVPA